MKKFSSYLLGLSLAVAVAGCGKKSDPTPATNPVSAKTALLTAVKWRITAIASTTTFLGQTVTGDSYASLPACQRDNFQTFATNLATTFDEGATKCSSSDPQTKQGTWSFNTAETQLTVVDPSQAATSPLRTATADIVQLSANAMQLRTTTTQTQGGVTVSVSLLTTYVGF
jgi:hypothetical protein